MKKIIIKDRQIKIPSILGLNCYLSEEWMIDILDILLQYKKCGFLDIGVNLGQTLIKVKTIDPQIEYFGFEPNPFCVFYLQQLIKANEFENCTIVPIGLFTENSLLFLECIKNSEVDPSASVIKNFRPDHNIYHRFIVPVFQFQTISSILDIKEIGLIKIDVEGSELEVVKSLYEVIHNQRPLILLEILPVYSINNKFRKERQEELQKIFTQENYLFFKVQKTSKNRLKNLVKIDHIEIHANLTECDYVFVPMEDVRCLL